MLEQPKQIFQSTATVCRVKLDPSNQEMPDMQSQKGKSSLQAISSQT